MLWRSRCHCYLRGFKSFDAAPLMVRCYGYFSNSVRGCDNAARGASAPPREPDEVSVGLSPRVNLNQHMNLVAVDFIGGDGAEGSIPCLKDDD